MSFTTPQDLTVTITVLNTATTTSTTTQTSPSVQIRTERRITPTWTIGQLKTKLEPITGIPAPHQTITHTNDLTNQTTTLEPNTTLVSDPNFGIHRNSELRVTDTRPVGLRANFTDVSGVEKYEMPVAQYEKLSDSVLAWKKRQGLGRFDPGAKGVEEMVEERREREGRVVEERGIQVGARCRVGGEDERRGVVRFVGEIEGLGGEKERGCVWVGVELDEPVGRNDGSVKVDMGETKEVKRIFECKDKFGVFARPEKIEAGDWPPLDDFDEDMEEI